MYRFEQTKDSINDYKWNKNSFILDLPNFNPLVNYVYSIGRNQSKAFQMYTTKLVTHNDWKDISVSKTKAISKNNKKYVIFVFPNNLKPLITNFNFLYRILLCHIRILNNHDEVNMYRLF